METYLPRLQPVGRAEIDLMVAYGFKAFFAPQIEAGVKRQTVRSERKRHARPGEAIQLYQGMRTRQCRKLIPDPPCTAVDRILIVRAGMEIVDIEINGMRLTVDEIEDFAASDGLALTHVSHVPGLGHRYARFNMGTFWAKNHPDVTAFQGVAIHWNPDAIST